MREMALFTSGMCGEFLCMANEKDLGNRLPMVNRSQGDLPAVYSAISLGMMYTYFPPDVRTRRMPSAFFSQNGSVWNEFILAHSSCMSEELFVLKSRTMVPVFSVPNSTLSLVMRSSGDLISIGSPFMGLFTSKVAETFIMG